MSVKETELGIQRCHRSPGPKLPPDAQPRSMVVYFLEFKTKELVLHSAWKKKKVYCNGKRIFFDQDYRAEIQKKRRPFAPIRKILKEKGIRFQTPPPAKLRIFLEGGPVTYSSVAEAMDDLEKRGLISGDKEASGSAPIVKLRKTPWETVQATSCRRRDAHQERIQDKLRRFQRDTVQPPDFIINFKCQKE